MEERKKGGGDHAKENAKATHQPLKANEDFRIALSAMVSPENMQLIEDQFLKNC